MFNEAFWFFYWVSAIEAASLTFGIVSTVGIAASLIAAGPYSDSVQYKGKTWKPYFRYLRWSIPMFALLGLLALFLPPKEAFYAGAGQYVAESAEVDQTLLRLKEVLDKKIEEMAAED